jgi:hypothetical protein
MTGPSLSEESENSSIIRVAERRLSVREIRVALSLSRIAPALGDLYRQTLVLSTGDGRPAFTGVAAHAARELNNGLLQHLVGFQQYTRVERTAREEDGETTENHADAMGRALNLERNHPSVRFWHALHLDLVGAAHYRGMLSNEAGALRAIADLTPLLDALVGPYFELEAELTAIVSKTDPIDSDFEAVRVASANVQLRWHCYRSFRGANWLRGLEERGCFGPPPMAQRFENQSWSPAPWFEGEYLLRTAPEAPELVSTILRRTPRTNDNPTVWRIMTGCALTMPMPSAKSLHRLIAGGITQVPFVIWPEPAVRLVKRFAAEGEVSAALVIAKTLCALEAPPVGEHPSTSFGLSRAPTFLRISRHDLPDVVASITDVIIAADARSALTWLVGALHAALRLTTHPAGEARSTNWHERALDRLPRWVAHRLEKVFPTRARHEDHSFWCQRLDDSDHDDDSRVILARALTTSAIALARASEEDARWALEALGHETHIIFRRIWKYSLARATPHAREMLNEWIGSETAVTPELTGRESGDILRLRFSESDPRSQARFAERVRRGPPLRDLRQRIAADRGETSTIEEVRKRWQIRMLRRFGETLPDSLESVAAEIGYEPGERSARQEGLDEDGSFSGGMHWVIDRSPFEPRQLERQANEEIASQLVSWRPMSGDPEAPSIRGLVGAVSELVAADPVRGLAIGNLLRSATVPAHAITAIANGLRDVPQDRRAGTPTAALAWLEWAGTALQLAGDQPSAPVEQWQGHHDANQACLETLQSWISSVRGHDELAALWRTIDSWLTRRSIWSAPHPIAGVEAEGLLMMALNSLQGIIANVVVRAVQRTYEDSLVGGRNPTAEEIATAKAITARMVTPHLNVLLTDGLAEPATLAALGSALPALLFIVPEWIIANRTRLLARADRSPLSAFWTAYVVSARPFPMVFTEFRGEYLASLSQVDRLPRDGQWAVPEHLAEHILFALTWGLVAENDPDRLLEIAWERLEADDLSHAYWTVFRAWSDADDVLPEEMQKRLVAFWSWRLAQLGGNGVNPNRVREEANALAWFCITPYVPADAILTLGPRTLDLADAKNRASMSLWEELIKMPDEFADAMWPIVSSAVKAELRGEYARLFAQHIGPVLTKLSVHGSRQTRDHVRTLINTLGGRGYVEFGAYLPPPDSPPVS